MRSFAPHPEGGISFAPCHVSPAEEPQVVQAPEPDPKPKRQPRKPKAT